MPTYVIHSAADRIDANQKQALAARITQIHTDVTGARNFFAQVIYQDIAQGNHFMGGKSLQGDQIFVYGRIRAGRTISQKRKLLADIVTAVSDVVRAERHSIWAYVHELPPEQMVEYGHELPQPGCEADWMRGLPEADVRYMESVEAKQAVDIVASKNLIATRY